MSLFHGKIFRFFTFSAAFLLLSSFTIWPQQYDLITGMTTNWENGDLTVTAEALIPEYADNLTTQRFRISEFIDRNLTEIATETFDNLYLDSLRTVRTFLKGNQAGMTEFDSLNYSTEILSSSLSRNLKSVKNIYKYNIYTDLMPILINHRNPAPVPQVLDFESTAPFSGIVIYASDNLPLYGEAETGLLMPAIFPKIFDENMNLTASAKMAEPSYLKKWGFAAYSDSTDLSRFENRIGLYPFFITAEAVFGNNRTDILISEDAARKILYNKANHRLIREGRILIIYKPGE